MCTAHAFSQHIHTHTRIHTETSTRGGGRGSSTRTRTPGQQLVPIWYTMRSIHSAHTGIAYRWNTHTHARAEHTHTQMRLDLFRTRARARRSHTIVALFSTRRAHARSIAVQTLCCCVCERAEVVVAPMMRVCVCELASLQSVQNHRRVRTCDPYSRSPVKRTRTHVKHITYTRTHTRHTHALSRAYIHTYCCAFGCNRFASIVVFFWCANRSEILLHTSPDQRTNREQCSVPTPQIPQRIYRASTHQCERSSKKNSAAVIDLNSRTALRWTHRYTHTSHTQVDIIYSDKNISAR